MVLLFFANNLIKFNIFHNTLLDSNHDPVLAEFYFGEEIFSKFECLEEITNIHNFGKANWVKFKKNLINRVDSFKDKDINQWNENICEAINKATKDSIPPSNKKKNQNNCDLPKYIIDLIQLKRYWRKKCNNKLSNITSEEKYKYHYLKELVRNEIKKAKEDSWQNFLDGLGKSPVSTVPFLKRINKFRENLERSQHT